MVVHVCDIRYILEFKIVQFSLISAAAYRDQISSAEPSASPSKTSV